MGIYLADQTLSFLQALVVGAALAFVFDAFRIARIALPHSVTAVFIEDLLFFIICAAVTFGLLMSTVEGQVRVFLLIGQALGALVYTITLGQLVMAVSKAIIRIIRGILHFLFRWILRPIYRLLYHIVVFLLRPVFWMANKSKKNMQKLRFYLKVRRILVYNHFKARPVFKRKTPGDTVAYDKSQKTT